MRLKFQNNLKSRNILVVLAILLIFLLIFLDQKNRAKQSLDPTKTSLSINNIVDDKETTALVVGNDIKILNILQDKNVAWRKFVYKNIFEIQYPSNWSTNPKDQGSQQGEVFNASISTDCGDQYCPTASLAINFINAIPSSTEYLQKEIESGWSEISDIYWVQVNNNKYLHYLWCQMGCYDVYIYPQYDNDSVYRISFYNSFSGNDEQKYKSLQDQILSSLFFEK